MSGAVEVLRLPEDRGRWLALLARLPGHDVYQRPEYLGLFDERVRPGVADAFRGRPLAFVLEDDAGLALHPLLERPLKGIACLEGEATQWRDLVSPYGYAGPLLVADRPGDTSLLAARFADRCGDRCREEGIVAEFIRFHPLLGNAAHAVWGTPDRRGDVVVVDLRKDDAGLLAAMSDTTRSLVRAAARRGIEVVAGEADAPATLERLYRDTMARRGAAPEYFFPDGFFAAMVAGLGDRSALFVAREGARAVAAAIFLACGPHASYAFAGTDGHAPASAGRAIVHEALRWARDRGCGTMLLGGGVGAGADGLFRFKRSFSRSLLPFHTAGRIHMPEAYRALADRRCRQLEAGGGITRRGPAYFPEYRR